MSLSSRSFPGQLSSCSSQSQTLIHACLITKLESVQRLAARLTTKRWSTSPDNLLYSLNWTTLRAGRKEQKIMVCARILNGCSSFPPHTFLSTLILTKDFITRVHSLFLSPEPLLISGIIFHKLCSSVEQSTGLCCSHPISHFV